MELDLTIHKGRADKPVVIFIHGLGIDKGIWLDPLNTRMFAKNVPIKIFAARRPRLLLTQNRKKITIGDIPEKVDTLWRVLRAEEFNLICWSQKRPVGPISVSVEELKKVIKIAGKTFPGRPLALIGHSRGGLVARKLMEDRIPGLKALITISTPHHGSSLALPGKYLKPLSPVIKALLPENAHGSVFTALKRVNELLEGNAAKELMPGSDFFKGLKDSPVEGIKYISFGGTRTCLLTVYKWTKQGGRPYPEPFLKIPDTLLKAFPSSALPDELVNGKGDVLVSAKNSVLPWAEKHYNVPANHVSILWHGTTIKKTLEILAGV